MTGRIDKLKTADVFFQILTTAVRDYKREGVEENEAADAAIADMTDYLAAMTECLAALKIVKREHDLKKLNTAHLTAH